MTVSLLVLAAVEALLALVFRSVDLDCLVVDTITSSYRHQPIRCRHRANPALGPGQA